MSDHKVVYLIIGRGPDYERQSIWRIAGNAWVYRDGSLNMKLDIHPGLTFNVRDPKSNGERNDAEAVTAPTTSGKGSSDDIPF